MFEHHEEHMLNPSPHSPHTKIIKHIGSNKSVLDVGCSMGYIAKELKRNGCSVIGIEIDEVAAEVAKGHCDKAIVGNVEGFWAHCSSFPRSWYNGIPRSPVRATSPQHENLLPIQGCAELFAATVRRSMGRRTAL